MPAVRGPISKDGLDEMVGLDLADTAHHLDIWPLTYVTGGAYFRDIVRERHAVFNGNLMESPNIVQDMNVTHQEVVDELTLAINAEVAEAVLGEEANNIGEDDWEGIILPAWPGRRLSTTEDCELFVARSLLEEAKRPLFANKLQCKCDATF